MIRLILPVMVGTLSALSLRMDIHVHLVLVSVLFCLFGGMVFTGFLSPSYRLRWVTGAVIMTLLALLSYEITVRKNELFSPDCFSRKRGDGPGNFIVKVLEPPAEKARSIKAVVRILATEYNGSWVNTCGKSVIYFQKDTRSKEIMYGDKILVRCTFREAQTASFPYSFDQRSYLAKRQISHTSYAGSAQWKTLPDQETSLQRFSFETRNRLLGILKEHGVSGREFAVASALLLGYVAEIDSEMIREYSATGAMHILSVSGMHVGIIFLVLDRLLAFLRKTRPGLLLKTFLIVLMIWFYALLTGLSPAVMRASVMITLVVAGKAMKREPDMLNIVAASFIILVMHEPTLILDIGFQMSYLAVAGIVLLYKPLYDLYMTSRFFPDKIWALMAVSLAAQLATFPLGLSYFHQFPNYFMLTNLFVVPLSTLAIYAGILLLVFNPVPVLPGFLSLLLTWFVKGLNQSVHLIEGLPFSVSRGVFITPAETILLYLVLVVSVSFLFTRRKIFLLAMPVVMILLQVSFLLRTMERIRTDGIIVYGSRGQTGIDLVKGDRSVLLYSQGIYGDPFFRENRKVTLEGLGIDREMRMMIKDHPDCQGEFRTGGWFYIKGNFVFFRGKRIGIMDGEIPGPIRKGLKLDYLIIRGGPDISIANLIRIFGAGEIIADPTNPPWRVKKWKAEAEKEGVKFFDVGSEGAYFRKWN